MYTVECASHKKVLSKRRLKCLEDLNNWTKIVNLTLKFKNKGLKKSFKSSNSG